MIILAPRLPRQHKQMMLLDEAREMRGNEARSAR